MGFWRCVFPGNRELEEKMPRKARRKARKSEQATMQHAKKNKHEMAAALAADLGRVAAEVADTAVTVSELSGACHEVTFRLMRPR